MTNSTRLAFLRVMHWWRTNIVCEISSKTTLLHYLYAVALVTVNHETTFLLSNLPCKYSNRLTSAQNQLECSWTPSKEKIIKFSENRVQKAVQEERDMCETYEKLSSPLSTLYPQARSYITSSQKGRNLMSVLKQSSIPNYSGPCAEGECLLFRLCASSSLSSQVGAVSCQTHQEFSVSETSVYNGLYNR